MQATRLDKETVEFALKMTRRELNILRHLTAFDKAIPRALSGVYAEEETKQFLLDLQIALAIL